MKNILLILVAILLLIATGYLFFSPNDSDPKITYTEEVFLFSSNDAFFTIQYSADSEYALVSLSGIQHELQRTRSASGAKYASSDGSVVFWEHAGEATFEINGEAVITNAVLEEHNQADSLITGTDEKSGITFTYPKEINLTYVTLVEWPPRFVNSLDPIQCELDEQTQAMSGATSKEITIDGNDYCVWETLEGTAGSVYKTYQFTYPKDGQYLTMSFTAQYPQCENFDDSEITICQTEQQDFLQMSFIDEIAQSAKLPTYQF